MIIVCHDTWVHRVYANYADIMMKWMNFIKMLSNYGLHVTDEYDWNQTVMNMLLYCINFLYNRKNVKT